MSLLADFTPAFRALRRRPFTTAVAVLMLGVGLGFNTALFAVVDHVVLRPLPYAHPDRVVMLWTGRAADGTGGVSSYADYLEWRAAAQSVDAIAVYNIALGRLTGAGDPEELHGAMVSGEFFRVLGAPVLIGRGLEPADDLISPEDVRPVVISHSLFRRRFSADEGVLNRTITLAGRPWRVVGVMTPLFRQPEPFWDADADFWIPMFATPDMRTVHGSRYLRAVARLKSGVTVDAAQRELDAIGQRLMATLPASHHASIVVSPIADELTGDVRPLAWIFLAATALVLLLVVVNIVTLLFARLNHRRSELALRVALGASGSRMGSLVLTESLLLGLAGGVVALLLARLALRGLAVLGPQDVHALSVTGLSWRVLAFAIALSVLTGLLCGLAPALRLARRRLGTRLGDTPWTTSVDPMRQRRLIIAAEVALAVPLIVAAVLLMRTLVSLQQVDPGFNPANAVQFRLTLDGAAYSTRDHVLGFWRMLIERLASVPGVAAAGATSSLPFGGLNDTGNGVVYERADGSRAEIGVRTRAVTADYFAAIGALLRQGRLPADSAADLGAVVINERAAATLWPGVSPIGRRLRLVAGDDIALDRWLTVIGVVGDMRHEALARPAQPEIFQPLAANPWSTLTVVVRTTGVAVDVTPALRAVVRELDPGLPIVALGAIGDVVGAQLRGPRFGAFCAIVFGALGVILASGGTFAVMWLLVAQRTREIGIRMAVGAAPASVASLVLAQALRPAAAGAAVGGLLAVWLARALESLLYGVRPADPLTFAASIIGVVAVAVVATALPAVRAMRTDPSRALRHTAR